MSETETLQAGQTDTVTGAGNVTTDDGMQQVISGDPTAAPVVDPATPAVEPTTPAVDPSVTPVVNPSQPTPVVTDSTSATPVVDTSSTAPPPVVDPTPAPAPATTDTVITYNGQAVVKRFGLFDADGAEECELADGSTAFVPKSILGA